MSYVFLFLLLSGFLTAALTGRWSLLPDAMLAAVADIVKLIWSFVGIMSFWLGIARVAERSGLLQTVTRVFLPLMRRLFPDVPPQHKALESIVLNLSANLFGFGSAATPFGLKAMHELQSLNPEPEKATPAMCTFLVLNTACLTLIPGPVIALRAAAGSRHPAEVMGAILFANTCSFVAAIAADRFFRYLSVKGRRL